MPPTDRDVLILGVGNADHGDEGIGCGIVRRLAVMQIPGVVTRCQGRDETNLVELWGGYEVVYLIDAMRAGSAPGTILRFDGHTALIPEGFGLGRRIPSTFGVPSSCPGPSILCRSN